MCLEKIIHVIVKIQYLQIFIMPPNSFAVPPNWDDVLCVPSWSIFNLMWHAYVRRCWKTTKDIYLPHVYIYQWLQNSAGRTQERVPCECLQSAQRQIFSPTTSTVLIQAASMKAASWLYPARLCSVFLILLATCSTLFPPVMPYLFFNTLRSTPYTFLGMPIHNPSFPLWSQHFIWCVLGPVAECFHFSTIFPNFYLQTIHSLFFFAQRINYWPDSTTCLFFSSPSSRFFPH